MRTGSKYKPICKKIKYFSKNLCKFLIQFFHFFCRIFGRLTHKMDDKCFLLLCFLSRLPVAVKEPMFANYHSLLDSHKSIFVRKLINF